MDVDPLYWLTGCGMLAAGGGPVETWSTKLWANVWDPWFVFGMLAQAVFFLRFLVQWIVSERRGESVIPIAFWYLSLLGSILIFIYAIKKADPVFMLASVLQCVIYLRNLTLIYRRQHRLQVRAG